MPEKPTYEELERRVGELEAAEAERENLVNALRRSESRLKQAQRIAKVASWDMDAKTGDGYWSDELFRLLGYQPGEKPASYRLFREHVHPDDVDRFEESIAKYTGRVKHVNEIFRFITTSGDIRFAHSVGNVEFDEAGAPVRAYGAFQDITERRQAEERLAWEHQLRTILLDNIPECIALILKKDTHEIVASNKLARDVGAVPGRTCFATCAMLDTSCPFCRAPRMWKTGEPQRHELKHRGGWYEGIWVPLSDELYVHYIIDITERKQAEMKIRNQARLLDLIFAHSLDSIVLLDAEYNFIRVSETYAKICRRDTSEFPGHNHFEFYPSDLKDKFDEVVKEKKIYQRAARPFEFPDHPEWGTTYWDLGLVPVYDNEDKIEFLLFTLKNVTDRKKAEDALKKSEEHLRLITDNLPAVVAHVDRDLTCLFANKAYLTFCGFNPEELIGHKISEVLDKGALDRAYPNIRKALKGEFVSMENRLTRDDGQDLLFQVNFVPHLNTNNEVAGYFVLGWDITERKRAEEALRSALDEKVILLREIHHRVKNNMQVIIGLLRMHSRRNQDPHIKTVFDDCRDRIEAMSLIHEALYHSDDLSRIDFEAYLKKLCRNLAQAHGARRKGITLTTSAEDVSLNMDQGVAVGMIIAELISNAFKHAFPDGEGGIVSVHLDRPGADIIQLIVSDTGKGLPPDFDIRNPPSLGMRLVAGAVTRELGGSIEAANDGGAKFVIRFKCGKGQ